MVDQTWYTDIALYALPRLKDHNSRRKRFNKGHISWKIIYTEVFENWGEATASEKYLKHMLERRA